MPVTLFRHGVHQLVAASALVACSASAQQYVTAETSDGRVRFTITEAMTRGAFNELCSSLVEEQCDQFERYRIEVVIEDAAIGLTFVHEDVGRRTVSSIEFLPAFNCMYLRGELECRTGNHRY